MILFTFVNSIPGDLLTIQLYHFSFIRIGKNIKKTLYFYRLHKVVVFDTDFVSIYLMCNYSCVQLLMEYYGCKQYFMHV